MTKMFHNRTRRFWMSLLIATLLAGITITYTWCIFSMHLDREPLTPPYNLSAFLVELPGIWITYLVVDAMPSMAPLFYPLTFGLQLMFIWLVVYWIAGRKRRSDASNPE